MDPALILTHADYEVPRTLAEMEAWWDAKYTLFASTKEGRDFARAGLGLTKRFHDEAQPMLAYMRRFPPAAGLRCQVLAGDDPADSLYLDTSGVAVRRFQVTTAVDGRTEALRRRQLSRDGHVDGLAKLNEDNVIPDDALPSDRYARIKEMAARILAVIEMKSRKGYGTGYTLIVGFNDNTFVGEGDLRRFKEHVGSPAHTFAELYVVGILGYIAIP